MANLTENYSFFEFLLLNFLAILLGYSIKFSLERAKQKWVATFHQTLSYCLLPSITSIITLLISSNIALSLGMIGALSIVRFRTPVKSPLELVMFFALITIGIGVAVNYKFSILLTLIIIIVLFIFSSLQNYYKKRDKVFLISSYDEGTPNNVLEVKSKKKIEYLDNSKNLESYYFNKNENSYNYRLLLDSKADLNYIKDKLEKNIDIEFIDIKYVF